jgi:cob(I)alamin adenosyltransferase
MRLRRGMVQIYTGDGKGKSTAAFGLALRAAGAGLKVYIQQFLKRGMYSEVKALRSVKNIRIEQCGNGGCVKGRPSREDISCAMAGLDRAKQAVASGRYDLVILDEINVALGLRMIKLKDVVSLIDSRPKGLEVVMTGRGCPAAVIRMADLVTEMKKLKHPYDNAVGARLGIER